jgi:catalase
MRADENGGDTPNYEPNSFGGPVQDPRYRERPYKVSGDVNRYNHREGNDDYKQAGDLFRLMTPDEKKALIGNIAGHMKNVPERITRLQVEHFTKADPAYGRGVAEALGVTIPELELAAAK